MKKRWGLGFILAMLLTLATQVSVFAAQDQATISSCAIAGKDVVVVSVGNVPTGDGMYYLFELKPYEAGIGARTNYCAAAPAAEAATFTTSLDFNTANSKLYSRFVVAALQNGAFVPVSNEMYITNPEAVAAKATAYPVRSKKGLTADWRYAKDLTALGAGFAAYEIDISRFYMGGGTSYQYNGKSYSFNSGVVAEYDAVVKMFCDAGCNVVMVLKNSYNPATADLILPTGRVPGMNCYAFNVAEQGGTEKIEALLSFLANRYSGGSYGTIHNWIVGNEINNNSPWHYAGDMGVDQFSAQYAKEFRVCYNAIKSQNAGARVFLNIDQRWTHTDSNTLAYKGRDVLDKFAAEITASGNIDWGLSFHPHPVPLFNTTFWNLPPAYAGLKLIDHTDNSKMVNPSNIDVVTNHMQQPELLSPSGTLRHMIISEMGFTSANTQIATNEQVQAAAMVYAYKLASQNPCIEGVVIHRQIDNASEAANDGMAVGIMTATGAPKPAYEAFRVMDTGNTDYLLPVLGASSWAELGCN